MTCIVAVKDRVNKKMWLGGDSAATSRCDLRLVALPKVFKYQSIMVGYTSSFRMGQLLQNYVATLDQSIDPGDRHNYMVTIFIPAIREMFKEHGYSKIENNEETGGLFIVVIDDRIFEVQSDFSVLEYADNFGAIGCGAPYALGALHINKFMPPKERLHSALQAAAYFSNGVSEPFTIISNKA